MLQKLRGAEWFLSFREMTEQGLEEVFENIRARRIKYIATA
jgi:hypothetical protein